MTRAVVIGASGYSGAELVGILARHEGAELVGLFGSSTRESATLFAERHPRFAGGVELDILPFSESAALDLAPDAVFLATPHEFSASAAQTFVDAGAVVFDLSGAFRLSNTDAYPAHYGFTHPAPALLAEAVYGLPELRPEPGHESNRDALADARLVACPGCYPTASILPIAPLQRAGRLDASSPVIIDAISGVSGAGAAASQTTHFCEVSVRPYKVLAHRHAPEIEQHAGIDAVFTPHLGPFKRGILATIHAKLAPGVSAADVADALRGAYEGEPFVRLRGDTPPAIGDVEGTNTCDIGWAVDGARGRVILFGAIDNLLKGAAGQAAQCFNIRFGFPETTGLGPLTHGGARAGRVGASK